MQNLISHLSSSVKASLVVGLMLLPMAELRAAGPFAVTTTADTHAASAGTSANDGEAPPKISLRSAIEAANAQTGATTINVPAGTYTLSLGELGVAPNGGKTITIIGAGASTTIISQGDGHNRVFNIDANSAGSTIVAIEQVTIEGGTDKADNFGGAGILAGSLGSLSQDTLSLTDCTIQNNQCQAMNSSGNPGGGVSMEGGSLTITACTFANNSSGSSQGGGAYFFPQNVASILTVSDSTFSQNSISDVTGAGVGGSAIGIGSTAANVSHSISGTIFKNNSVGTGAGAADGPTYGAIQVLDGGSGNVLAISDCTFTGNSVTSKNHTKGLGGALAVNSGHVTVSDCRFVNNTADAGSAIFSSLVNSAVVGATENWWSCNGGPAAGCQTITGDGVNGGFGSTVTFNPWLMLSFTPNPSPINTGGATTLTASFLKDSAGTTLSASSVSVLDNVLIEIGNPVLGSLSSIQTAIQSSGTASATFTAGATGGTGHADATVDEATVTANISINAASLIINTDPSDTSVCADSEATFFASATGNPTPTLKWQVSVSGGPFTDIPSATTSPLTFTASAGDDGNQDRAVFSNGTTANTTAATLTINAPPVAGTDALGTIQDVAVNAPVSKLLANDSSPISGALSITGVSSPTAAGGAAVLNGQVILYTPKAGFFGSDSFTYTLSDTRCTGAGTVNVTVTSANAPSLNNISVTLTGTGRVVLFAGIPGVTYVVQSSPNVNGPWTDAAGASIVAGPTGLVQYTDSTSPIPPTQFYRTRVGP